MNRNAILQSDVLDIIFENRNKLYGAYALRKFYNDRLYKALGGTFLIVIALCGLSFLKKDKVHTPLITVPVVMGNIPPAKEKIAPPKEQKPEAKPAASKPKTAPAPSQAFTSHPVVKNDPKIAEIKDLDDKIEIDDKTVVGDPAVLKPIIKLPEGPEIKGIPAPEKPAIDKITPTAAPEVMPEYPGGMAALRKFLEKNLVSPEEVEAGSLVSVKVRFIVGYDGMLKGFEIIKDGGQAFNNEVIRVLKKMKP